MTAGGGLGIGTPGPVISSVSLAFYRPVRVFHLRIKRVPHPEAL